MGRLSYSVGQLLGAGWSHLPRWGKALPAVALVIWSAYMVVTSRQTSLRAAEEQRAQQAKVAAEAEAQRREEQARAAEQRATCAAEEPYLIARAKGALQRKDVNSADRTLYPCAEFLKSPAYVAATDAVQAAKVAAAEASAKREQVAEAARRRKEGVALGMTQQEVLASQWGRPQKVNRTTTRSGTHEQWVYPGGYLYFDDGILTGVQN